MQLVWNPFASFVNEQAWAVANSMTYGLQKLLFGIGELQNPVKVAIRNYRVNFIIYREIPKWVDWSVFLLPGGRYLGGLPI